MTGTTTAGGERGVGAEVQAGEGTTSPRGRRETGTTAGIGTGIGGEQNLFSVQGFLHLNLRSRSRHHRDKSPHRNSSSKREERDNRSSTIRETSLFAEMIKKKNLREKLTGGNRRPDQRGDVNQHGAPPTAPAAAGENNSYHDHHRHEGNV